ncbi:protocadherin gamma-A5-like [Tubulanus polymorphus]|uniref:protocadherin gamma-A5-like n=1 Tax=Tubulanus polymorphus TaxID=672921 RepID=UPI003DA59896
MNSLKRGVSMVLVGVFFVQCIALVSSAFAKNNAEILFRLPEENQPDTFVGEIRSSSVLTRRFNASVRARLRYSLLNPNDPGVNYFRIDEKTSVVTTTQVIDRDTLCSVVPTCCVGSEGCYIPLIIGIQPREYFTVLNAKVDVIDINDNAPVFQQSTVQIKMSESAPINTTTLLPTAEDIDAGINNIKTYTIISPTRTFGLKTYKFDNMVTDIALVNMLRLDRESISHYQVKVLAVDGGLPELTGTCTINIEITDANDNTPKFAKSSYSVSIPENTPTNTSILQVHAVDPDLGESGKVRYMINLRASDVIKTTFVVEPFSGWIKLMKPMNYENTKLYKIPIDAKDLGTGALPSRTSVTVHVTDANDNAPIVTANLFTSSGKAEVSEAANIGTLVAHILVQDADSGLNGEVNCYMDSPYFRLLKMDSTTQEEYKVVTATKLNRETTSEYQVTVICRDNGEPTLETHESFTIDVLDANDNMPIFSQSTYTTEIAENNPLGMSILQVRADDQDDGPGGQVRYKMQPDGIGIVTINHEGTIYASKAFDRERESQVRFSVVAYDHGEPPLSSTATVVINIKDENDNAPRFLGHYKFNVTENSSPHHAVIGRVLASDDDVKLNAIIDYTLGRGEGVENFEISRRKGEIIARKRLDREHRAKYTLEVIATDHGVPPMSGRTNVIIDVLDTNDNPPVFSFPNHSNNTVYISYLEPPGHKITQVRATDTDHGNNGKLLYYITHGNIHEIFSISRNNGVISVSRKLALSDAITYKLTIEVRDRGIPQNTNVETLTIVVDGSGKPITLSGTFIEKPPNNKNLIIVICLATVSGLLAIVLIVAIICIRKKDVNNHNYNVKTETQRIFNNRRMSPNHSNNGSPGSKYEDNGKPMPKKEVSFSLDNDEISDQNESAFLPVKNEATWGTTKTFEMLQTPSLLTHDSTPVNPSMYDKRQIDNLSGHRDPWSKREHQPWKSKHNEPQMKGLADLMKKHPNDTDSESSTVPSVTTTDSGRGGSDSDYCGHNYVPVPNHPQSLQLKESNHVIHPNFHTRAPPRYPRKIVNARRSPLTTVPSSFQEKSINNERLNNSSLNSFRPWADTSPDKNVKYEHSPSPSLRRCARDSRSNSDSPPVSKKDSESIDPEKLCVEIENLFFHDVNYTDDRV